MKKTLLADSSLLFVAFIWGTTFVLVQNAIRVLEPMSFNATRFFLAGMILLLWLFLFYRSQIKQINKKMLTAGILMGLWLFSGYALQTFGLLYTTSSKAGFITGLSVVLVPLFAFFLLKQKPKPNAILGVLVATVGLYMLTLGDSVSVNKGDVLVFFCAISFALHIIFTGKYTTLFPTLLLTVTQILTVAVLCSVFAFIFEDWKAIYSKDILLSNEVIIALLITSIFATALAFFLQTNFQKYTTPTRVALIFAMEPVFAALGGYYLADERLTLIAIFGCLFIFVGMIFTELPGRKKKSIQASEHISY
ncbi:DMT family transporter [Bacillus luteolus]|uniref:DMT family transporter n=1 Tax=Litchfieldia luteola TaxID=682179 RepID=A0ABR9QNU0_9BACI|nr:DMT family transporter [Cytobacillus luteolus]MBE4910175.1 DMT family transporter [Cytobacillus luteolus]MBP1942259.1 drug/metabolite transporter (DMT)-like permease [Cytobacillus luteolus]